MAREKRQVLVFPVYERQRNAQIHEVPGPNHV